MKFGVINKEEIKESIDYHRHNKLYLTGKTYDTAEEMVAGYRSCMKDMTTDDVVKLLQYVKDGQDSDTKIAIDFIIKNARDLKFLEVPDGSYLCNRIWIHNDFWDSNKLACDFEAAKITGEKIVSRYTGKFDSKLEAAKYMAEHYEYICVQNTFSPDYRNDDDYNSPLD